MNRLFNSLDPIFSAGYPERLLIGAPFKLIDYHCVEADTRRAPCTLHR